MNRTAENKYSGSYRKSIWVRFHGRDYLQAVFDSPRKLRRALTMLRNRKNREYVTDDANNP